MTVTTPMFNKFSKYDLCENNKNYELCQEFTSIDYSEISDLKFTDKVKEYEVQRQEEEKRESSPIYNLAKFIKKYLVIIVIVIVLLMIAVIIRAYSRKKSRLI